MCLRYWPNEETKLTILIIRRQTQEKKKKKKKSNFKNSIFVFDLVHSGIGLNQRWFPKEGIQINLGSIKL